MKTIVSILIAAALVTPAMASAQRVTTPRTAERHAENLAKAQGERTQPREEERRAENDRETRDRRVPAAKAGKVILSAPAASQI